MARSRKHFPRVGCDGKGSNKLDKRYSNKRLRRAVRMRLGVDAKPLPLLREISNTRSFYRSWWRMFDPRQHPEWMRK